MSSTLQGNLLSDSLDEASVVEAIVLSDDLPTILSMSPQSLADEERYRFWNEESDALAEQMKAVRLRLSKRNVRIAILAWWKAQKRIAEIVSEHGPGSLFYSVGFLGKWFRFSIARGILSWALDAQIEPTETNYYFKRSEWLASEARELAPLLIASEPWVPASDSPKETQMVSPLEQITFWDGPTSTRYRWPADPKISEAVLVSLAIMSELEGRGATNAKHSSRIISDLTRFAFSRSTPEYHERAHEIVEERCASEAVKKILHAWIQGIHAFTRVRLN